MEKKIVIAVRIISTFIIAVNLSFLLFPNFINSLAAADSDLAKYVAQYLFGFHIFLSEAYGHMFLMRGISFAFIVLAVFLFRLNNAARILFIIPQFIIILGNGLWSYILFALAGGSKGQTGFGGYLQLAQAFIVLSSIPIIYCVFFMLPKVKRQFTNKEEK
jgi:hypothetical protein